MFDEPSENDSGNYDDEDMRKLKNTLSFPDQFPEEIRMEDDYFLHINLPIFTTTKSDHCYLLMENTANSNLSVKSVATKGEDDDKMHIKFDFSSQLELIIGNY
jgi:hypothetical protein